MVYPLLPAFITGVLGGGAVALGALDGAADAAAALVKLVAGRFADRPARRGPLIVAGYFIAAAGRPVLPATPASSPVIPPPLRLPPPSVPCLPPSSPSLSFICFGCPKR